MARHIESTTEPPTSQDGVVFPPDDLEEMLNLARFLKQHTSPGLLLGPDGDQVPLPEAVYNVLKTVAEQLRLGNAVLVAPKEIILTTQEAAEFLGISRPTFVKLLEAGEIPYDQPNRHRRVQLKDLIEYQARRRAERRETLNRMTEEASKLRLLDATPADYEAALRAARHRRAKR